jgi:hypothetical protein
VKCPNCARVYERRDFEPDESYFECPDCEAGLVFSPEEQRAELRRSDAAKSLDSTLHGRPSSPFVRPSGDGQAPSLLPLRIWIGLLAVGAILTTIRGAAELAAGANVEGAVALTYSLGVLAPTLVGLLRRMRFALYSTYFIFALNFINVLLIVIQNAQGPNPRFAGTVVGAIVFGTIGFLWLRWFVRNRGLFGRGTPRMEVVDDIYSPTPERDA